MDGVLVPEFTTIEDGTGAVFELGPDCDRLLFTLRVTRILEQESLNVSIWGSADEKQWRQLMTYPQKSYCGRYLLMLDLQDHPEVRYLRAQWRMSRWGLDEAVLAGFSLSAEELKTGGAKQVLAMAACAAD